MSVFDDISKKYIFSIATIEKVFKNHPYKRKEIIEKNGNTRIVYAPSSIIKMCQQYVLKTYLQSIGYSRYAFAYTHSKSIVQCALIHQNGNHMLHLDIRHFFDNINWKVFKSIILKDYSDSSFASLLTSDEKQIKQILCFRKRFCQGAVTSPYISNIYLKDFDNFLGKWVQNKLKNGHFSRYSDDIYISSSELIPVEVINIISRELIKKRDSSRDQQYPGLLSIL